MGRIFYNDKDQVITVYVVQGMQAGEGRRGQGKGMHACQFRGGGQRGQAGQWERGAEDMLTAFLMMIFRTMRVHMTMTVFT